MSAPDLRSVRPERVLLKAALLFLLVNILFAWLDPPVENLLLFRNARRFPSIWEPAPGRAKDGSGFGRVMISDLDLLFRSHVISYRPKAEDEYRVILLGDSAAWGSYLRPEQTMEALINDMRLVTCTGKRVAFYNLGYPFLSATKDLILLSEAMKYEPDMIIWSFSLIGFTAERQTIDFVAENPARVKYLAETYGLEPEIKIPRSSGQSFWERTLVGRRRALSLVVKLNLSELMLRALETDEPRATDDNARPCRSGRSDSLEFWGFKPPARLQQYANFESLQIARQMTDGVELIYLNEPMCSYANPDVRYNHHYPRWAYDQYRDALAAKAAEQEWTYLDWWNILPLSKFSNSIFHRTPEGEQKLALKLAKEILAHSCRNP